MPARYSQRAPVSLCCWHGPGELKNGSLFALVMNIDPLHSFLGLLMLCCMCPGCETLKKGSQGAVWKAY